MTPSDRVLERVARAIYEADYKEAEVKGDYDKYRAFCAEGPDINLYLIFAQAALKELRFDEVVGALKNTAALVSLGIKAAQADDDNAALEHASKEISKWPDWKKEAFGIPTMTDNIIKEALEYFLSMTPSSLPDEDGAAELLGLAKDINKARNKARTALSLIERGEVRYKDKLSDRIWAVELSGTEPVLVIPLGEET